MNDTLEGLWNTIAGGDGTLSTPGTDSGNYIPNEGPRNAFDKSYSNKFLSFGHCNSSQSSHSLTCGLNTGFHLTLNKGAIILKGFRFSTANDEMDRDPISVTFEGSNETNSTALLFGSSWTLIYNGTSGLDADPGRQKYGQVISILYNVVAYASYRILTIKKRGINRAVQYAELELFA